MIESLFSKIEPARAMGIEVTEWNAGRVELTAPLLLNRNDKQTAFAGSIASILTLASWSALTLALRDAGVEAEVMVVESKIDYRSAVSADLCASAYVSPAEVSRILKELAERGRSRAIMQSALASAATMQGSYAIRMPTT